MGNLLRLIGRRLVALPVMAVDVFFLVFFTTSLFPIDPTYLTPGETVTPGALEEYRVQHGLNDPLFVQYGRYLWDVLHGDLGTYGTDTSSHVTDLVAQALPIALQLTFLGLFFTVITALSLGVLAALYRGRWPDRVIRMPSVIGTSTPSSWLAALLILGFVQKLPVFGPLPAFSEDPSGWFLRMFLPTIVLAVPVIGQMTRVVRTSMVEELDRDYIRAVVGTDTPKRIVVARNMPRNVLITPVTILDLRVGYLMGGAVAIEIIFSIGGMDKAVLLRDTQENWVTLVQGGAFAVAIAFTVVNITVDMLYLFIDPRIRSV